MSADQWLALALFAFVSSITPGPNNLMATASGARFGLRRTIPQVAGVTVGFTALLWLAASGVAVVVESNPAIGRLLAAIGYAYLAWLAMRLLASAWHPKASGSNLPDPGAGAPPGFWSAVAFQFVNPKGWMMALATASSFLAAPGQSPFAIVGVGLLFAAINFPCVGAWALMGARLRDWLRDPSATWRPRAFDGVMGAMLVATIAWMATMP